MCLVNYGCLGCSFCSELPLSPAEEKNFERKRLSQLREEGKPTLSFKLGEMFRRAEVKGGR